MIIVPAIDIIDGKCVRLMKGRYDEKTVYGDDPVSMALSFQRAGAKRIHIVDLDAARTPGKNNRDVIRAICRETDMIVEVGGGIRTDRDVEELLEAGVDRLVVGTILVRDPDRVASWVSRYGGCFVAGIDALNREVKISGWESGSGIDDEVLASQVKDLGCVSIIYTNIDKDGTLAGPDIDSCQRIYRASGLPVVISGGISSCDDFSLGADKKGIAGAITGRALYEGRLDLDEAIKRYQKNEEEAASW